MLSSFRIQESNKFLLSITDFFNHHRKVYSNFAVAERNTKWWIYRLYCRFRRFGPRTYCTVDRTGIDHFPIFDLTRTNATPCIPEWDKHSHLLHFLQLISLILSHSLISFFFYYFSPGEDFHYFLHDLEHAADCVFLTYIFLTFL